MNTPCSFDPAPGTERLPKLTCQVCGSYHLNRTGMCDECRDKALEIGKAVLMAETVSEDGVVIIGNRQVITRTAQCQE